MTRILNVIKDKNRMLLAFLATMLSVAIGSAIVTADIPNSNTGQYNGCHDNSTGAVRVIDAQNSESCSGSETAMNWPSSAPLVAHAMIDTSGNLDTNFSSSEVQSASITQNSNGEYDVCFQLSFNPKFGRSTTGTNNNDINVRGGTTNEQGSITANCGSSYEAYTTQPSLGDEFKYIFFE